MVLWDCEHQKNAKEEQNEDVTAIAREVADGDSSLCAFVHAFQKKHGLLGPVIDPNTKYQKMRKLGQGAFGTVYRVEEIGTDRRFAMKEVVKPATGEKSLENCMEWKALLTEIEVLSEINHFGCITLHELIDTPNYMYMIVELVRGASLQVFATVHPMSERDISEIGCHVLTALQYLHETLHIVHRDIKPENILICRKEDHDIGEQRVVISDGKKCPISGQLDEESILPLGSNGDCFIVKLVDFGSSRFIRDGLLGGRYGDVKLPDNCTENMPAVTPVGTSLFVALETIDIALGRGSDNTSLDLAKIDIYAVGVVLYIFLCRQHPFMGTNIDGLERMRDKMIDDTGNSKLEFPSDAEMEHPLSNQSKDLLSNLLSLNPADRPTASAALRHPWLVCRHYRCKALRSQPLPKCESVDYVAPEDRPTPPRKRQNIDPTA
eukprot:TRINITY_DN4504_c0_g2_i1.p1 TRINITY_DN4504_c0_g2~~TRINITY_DN4504_c0_g2_i1.p1  ORF type:complete len:450 (+),score=89.66 TRINITY_DN4504_c0_g2_i1:43-1350(+)